MQLPELVSTSLGWLAFELARLQPFIPTYAHLIVSALFPIYAGAHSSLSRPSSAAKKVKSTKKVGEVEDEDEEIEQRMEGLSPTDALLFPLLAGTTLAGLYFLLKWLQDPALLNKLLNWYFATFSVFSVSRLVSDGLDVVHSLAFPHDYVFGGVLYHTDPSIRRALPVNSESTQSSPSPLPGIFSQLPLPQSVLNFLWFLHVAPNRKFTFKAFVRRLVDIKVGLGIHGVEGLVIGLSTVLYYNFVDKPWYLTNLMGFGFAYGAMQLMSPTTFWTGTLILSGLFFYDIYFVFFTPMMVTVAKSLDIPIKLLFPRPAEPDADPARKAMSMLGLGDVVLPGIMIGLALRFDLFLYYLRKQTKIPAESQKDSALEETSNIEAKPMNKANHNESPSEVTTTAPKPTAHPIMTTIKAPYTSVAEGWGDRLWTTSPFTTAPTYSARGVFPKTYFNASLAGYIIGMLATLAAMQISEHPQPALLYLVPGVLSSLWGTAWVKGEFREMWEFSDAAEDQLEKGDASRKDGDGVEGKKEVKGSFFGFARGEERSKRLEKAMSKHVAHAERQKDASDGKDATSDKGKAKDAYTDRTFISFSITLPPPAFPESAESVKDSSISDVAAQRGGRKWSAAKSGEGGPGHADKRQRLV